MKNEFVPYELAVKLKELGFDKACLLILSWINDKDAVSSVQYEPNAWICKNTKIEYDFTEFKKEFKNEYSVELHIPLWQQAFDWFREKYRIDIVIHNTYSFDENPTYIAYVDREIIKDPEFASLHSMGLGHKIFVNYPEARQACLAKLIELVPNPSHSTEKN